MMMGQETFAPDLSFLSQKHQTKEGVCFFMLPFSLSLSLSLSFFPAVTALPVVVSSSSLVVIDVDCLRLPLDRISKQ